MTLRDFNCLSDMGKDEAVEFKGTLLTEKLVPGFKVALYQIDNFFVEVYVDIRREVIHHFKGCVRSDFLYN